MASPGPSLCVLGLLLCAAASLLAAAPVSTGKPIIGKEAGRVRAPRGAAGLRGTASGSAAPARAHSPQPRRAPLGWC